MAYDLAVSLRIRYKKYPAPGGFYYAASIPVDLSLPAKGYSRSKRFDAIIDSGAASCLFHASLGRALGLDIEAGEPEYTQVFLMTFPSPDCWGCVGSLRTLRSRSIRLRSKSNWSVFIAPETQRDAAAFTRLAGL